jgi:integrase
MSIRKRTWKSAGEIRTAWVVNYTDRDGNRRLKTFELRKDAAAWWTTVSSKIKDGTHVPDNKITLGALYQLWIDDCANGGPDRPPLERTTIEQRRQHLRLHIDPFMGRVKLTDLTTAHVTDLMSRLRAAGRSVAMVRKVRSTLRTALEFAREQKLVAVNVVAVGRRTRANGRHDGNLSLKAGRDFPTKAELKLLIDNAPERWRAFIVTAVFTGMRASELRGLPWSNVDFDNRVIHVSQRADLFRKIGPPKSKAGWRDIPMTPLVVNALRQHKLAIGGNELVFPSRTGGVAAHTNFLKHTWKPLQEACSIGYYEFHSLRHAAASLFIELGWQPKRIQAVLGHSSITMTFDRYGHLFPQEDLAAGMAKLEAAVVAV